MTLYSQADSNIRKTWFYLTGFLVFVILVGWLFSYIFDSYLVLLAAVFYSFFMSFLSYWYSDKIVLAISRARLVKKEDNPELYRVVENLCITAGLPLPKIYVIDEAQPNAFATGRDPQHAVVAVTKGLLEKLEKVELEGVIAHELSHIGNRDALLQTVIVVLVGTVASLSSIFFRISFRSRSGGNKKGGGILVLIGILFALLAPLAANLLKLAVSRKREFLADASGALLTRYPEGLARALEKISQDQSPLPGAGPATAHLYIASPIKGENRNSWISRIFLTHPPVEERIKVLRAMG